MKVHLASSRPEQIGNFCREWADAHRNVHPEAFTWSNADDCDVFVSVLYDRIIPEEFIRGRRCYNFHPGILPSYRGSGVYSWVLINKEKETGVTLHEIDKDIDHGPIIDVSRTVICERDTAETLFHRCMNLLFRMFEFWFPKLLANDYITTPNIGGRLYLRRDLERAKDITHIIRAFEFTGKESAFWYDSTGHKHHVRWK